MDKPISDRLVEAEFEQVRRGYDPIAVSSFLNKLSQQARQLEAELANANARYNALERRLNDSENNKSQVSAAFVAAADAKQALLQDAERQAARILERARVEAERLSSPHENVETSRIEVAELLLQAKRRLDQAERDAEAIVAKAKKEAEGITTRTRTEALSAVNESKSEAQRTLAEAENEYRRVSLMLRGLKSAVREMLNDGEANSEDIAVVLGDTVPLRERPVRLG